MSYKLPILAIAATAAANITTTFWMPRNAEGELTFLGSVVDAKEQRTTIAVEYGSDDEQVAGMGLYPGITQTFTIASTLWEQSTSDMRPSFLTESMTTTQSLDYSEHFSCEMEDLEKAIPTCTFSHGNVPAWQIACGNVGTRFDEPQVRTEVFTYSADEDTRLTVLTTTWTIAVPEATPTPSWCEASAQSVPESDKVFTSTVDRHQVGTYELIITAGLDKLSATAGATNPVNTGTQGGSKEENNPNESASGETGAAMPMRTVAPLAGLGAAVAAFML